MQSSQITFAQGWRPFSVGKPDVVRALASAEGVADRLRVVAFAELQARDAFLWGAERFPDAPEEWRQDWLRFAAVEDRHAQMLLDRMTALGVEAGARKVSDKLSHLCRMAEDPVTFLFLLSSAEERGMEAGMILGKQMQAVDPISAAIFAQIAEEEVEHVASATAALAGQSILQLKEKAKAMTLALAH